VKKPVKAAAVAAVSVAVVVMTISPVLKASGHTEEQNPDRRDTAPGNTLGY